MTRFLCGTCKLKMKVLDIIIGPQIVCCYHISTVFIFVIKIEFKVYLNCSSNSTNQTQKTVFDYYSPADTRSLLSPSLFYSLLLLQIPTVCALLHT